MVILKIAFRNLKEHKSKTLIVGSIIAVGIMVLVIGNSMMDTATNGIRNAYWDNYTGHIVITGIGKNKITLFGPEGSTPMNATLPRIPRFDEVYKYITSLPEVIAVNPQAYGMAIIDAEERSFTQLFGIDPNYYRKMFPNNLEIISGKFLDEGENGILLSEGVAKRLMKKTEEKIKPGQKVLLTSMNDFSGMKIREVPIVGIFRFKTEDPVLNFVSIADIETVRALNGMTVTSEEDVKLNKDETALLGNVNDENLFGDDSIIGDVKGNGGSSGGSLVENINPEKEKLDESSLLNILGDTSKRERLAKTDSGAWHFLLVKVKNPSSINRVVKKINQYFDKNGIDAKANDWISSAGMTASLANNIKIVFNIVILIIAVVAIIIIMNTIVISVTERIGEIGTMRAIGAQKSFIRRMIIAETTMISLVFGILGIVLGTLVLSVLNLKGIPAPNIFFEVIFGGKTLHPVLSLGAVLTSLGVIVIIGIAASLYPVAIALKIQPVQAMQRAA